MLALAALLVQAQPEWPKIFSRFTPPGAPDSEPGMWSAVLGSKGTTSNRVRSKAAGKVGSITVFMPLPLVGAAPLISLRAYVPYWSQLNKSLFAAGTQGGVPVQAEFVHVGDWNFWAM